MIAINIVCLFLWALANGDKEMVLFWGLKLSENFGREDLPPGELSECLPSNDCISGGSELSASFFRFVKALEVQSPPNQARRKALWDDFLVRVLTGLNGYGIALMGNNLRCESNRVTGLQSCPEPKNIAQIEGSPPAIAGIWQFWDQPEWAYEQTGWGIFNPVLRVLRFLWMVSAGHPARIDIVNNRVDSALMHGIYSVCRWGMRRSEYKETSDMFFLQQNHVTDAVLHGIHNWPHSGLFHPGLYEQNHMNHTIVKTAHGIPAWAFDTGLRGTIVRLVSGSRTDLQVVGNHVSRTRPYILQLMSRYNESLCPSLCPFFSLLSLAPGSENLTAEGVPHGTVLVGNFFGRNDVYLPMYAVNVVAKNFNIVGNHVDMIPVANCKNTAFRVITSAGTQPFGLFSCNTYRAAGGEMEPQIEGKIEDHQNFLLQ